MDNLYSMSGSQNLPFLFFPFQVDHAFDKWLTEEVTVKMVVLYTGNQDA